ncbi:MAG TPA: SpoIIE family protein phosphatase [Bacteroidia bacterium]|jgi:serine phosphatase RsbU (regulator of sigma subunit)/HAMP domain-containing protein
MRTRFTIGLRILFGFGVLVILTLVAFGLTLVTINQSKSINDKITTIYTPSVNALRELSVTMLNSKMLIYNWVNTPGESEDKPKLKKLIYDEYPVLKNEIKMLSQNWEKDERDAVEAIFTLIDKLFEKSHKYIMGKLNNFAAYDDLEIKFEMSSVLNEGEEINTQTRLILAQLDQLIAVQQEKAAENISEMDKSFSRLKLVVMVLGVALPVIGLVIALLTRLSIVRPVDELKRMLQKMKRGVMPEEKIHGRNDEIGEMSMALNQLVDALKQTTEFAREVGSGNFDSHYEPLSEEDTLGHALLKMRMDLAENERILEQKVEERTAEVVQQKQEIEMQKIKMEVLFNHVTDSIRYAKRIQEAILPPDHLIKSLLPDSFVYYKPKDIVSGDFYWLEQVGTKVFFAAVDCTGHGVPGAFMSIVGHNQLKQVMNRITDHKPSVVLDELSKGISDSLHQNYDGSTAKDGMDLSLCSIDFEKKELEFSGAFNPLYLIRDNDLQEVKANKFPIGIFLGREARNFTNHKIGLEKGDVLYIFSDGYADQFGGPKGKKFMANQFRNLLMQIHHLPMEEQKEMLDRTLETWKGSEEQVDDILVIGVRING